jgi:glycosyl transferase family 25
VVYLNDDFQVKVISRIGSPRRNQIQDNLKSKNISFDFFDAADKTNIIRNNKTFCYKDLCVDLNTNIKFGDAFSTRGWMKIGEVGCFFSHYLLWLDLINTNKKAYFILEDDANPDFSGKEIEKFVKEENLDNIDMVICQSVSPNFPKGKSEFNKTTDKMNIRVKTGIFDWETTEGTTGYIVTNSGAKKLIQVVKEYQLFNPVDNFIGRCIQAGLVTFLCPNYIQVKLNENVQTEIHYDVPDQLVEYIDNIKFITG